jgi:hypothetical protein
MYRQGASNGQRIGTRKRCARETFAHRQRTVGNASQILVLKAGHSVERDTREALMALGELYAGLCRVQSSAITIEEGLAEIGVRGTAGCEG